MEENAGKELVDVDERMKWWLTVLIICGFCVWTGKAWGVRRTHVAATHCFISTSGCEWNKPNLELHPRKRLSTLVNKLILNLSLNSIIKQALLKHNNLFLNKLINMRLGLSKYMYIYIYIYIWEMLRVQHFYNNFFFLESFNLWRLLLIRH